jgi:hypothetical protein
MNRKILGSRSLSTGHPKLDVRQGDGKRHRSVNGVDFNG